MSEHHPIGSLHSDKAEIRRLRAENERLRGAIGDHRTARMAHATHADSEDAILWAALNYREDEG